MAITSIGLAPVHRTIFWDNQPTPAFSTNSGEFVAGAARYSAVATTNGEWLAAFGMDDGVNNWTTKFRWVMSVDNGQTWTPSPNYVDSIWDPEMVIDPFTNNAYALYGINGGGLSLRKFEYQGGSVPWIIGLPTPITNEWTATGFLVLDSDFGTRGGIHFVKFGQSYSVVSLQTYDFASDTLLPLIIETDCPSIIGFFIGAIIDANGHLEIIWQDGYGAGGTLALYRQILTRAGSSWTLGLPEILVPGNQLGELWYGNLVLTSDGIVLLCTDPNSSTTLWCYRITDSGATRIATPSVNASMITIYSDPFFPDFQVIIGDPLSISGLYQQAYQIKTMTYDGSNWSPVSVLFCSPGMSAHGGSTLFNGKGFYLADHYTFDELGQPTSYLLPFSISHSVAPTIGEAQLERIISNAVTPVTPISTSKFHMGVQIPRMNIRG